MDSAALPQLRRLAGDPTFQAWARGEGRNRGGGGGDEGSSCWHLGLTCKAGSRLVRCAWQPMLRCSAPCTAGVTKLDVSEGPISTEEDLDNLARAFPGLRSLSLSGIRWAGHPPDPSNTLLRCPPDGMLVQAASCHVLPWLGPVVPREGVQRSLSTSSAQARPQRRQDCAHHQPGHARAGCPAARPGDSQPGGHSLDRRPRPPA